MILLQGYWPFGLNDLNGLWPDTQVFLSASGLLCSVILRGLKDWDTVRKNSGWWHALGTS